MLFSWYAKSDSLFLHYFPKFAQTHVHWVSDAIQPFYPPLCPSPPAFNLSQHQGLLQWVGSSHINETVQNEAFSAWLPALSIKFSWFTYIVAYISTSFLNNILLCAHPTFSLSTVEGCLGCFYLLAIVNSKLLWTFLNKYLFEHLFATILSIYLGVEWVLNMLNISYIWNTHTHT